MSLAAGEPLPDMGLESVVGGEKEGCCQSQSGEIQTTDRQPIMGVE
eukprot:SAG25_NODE_706_length_5833_cov_3.268875_4_plen_46_part_00